MTLPDDCENYTFLLVRVDASFASIGEKHFIEGSKTVLIWPNQTVTAFYDTDKRPTSLNLSGTSLKLGGSPGNSTIKAVVGFKCADLTA